MFTLYPEPFTVCYKTDCTGRHVPIPEGVSGDSPPVVYPAVRAILLLPPVDLLAVNVYFGDNEGLK